MSMELPEKVFFKKDKIILGLILKRDSTKTTFRNIDEGITAYILSDELAKRISRERTSTWRRIIRISFANSIAISMSSTLALSNQFNTSTNISTKDTMQQFFILMACATTNVTDLSKDDT
jgi:hypothetical protein